MKRYLTTLASLLLVAHFAGPVVAQQGGGPAGSGPAGSGPAGSGPARPGQAGRPDPAALLGAMDSDGDGRISLEEFEPPRRGPRGEMLERADSDGDGRVSREEYDALQEQLAARMGARADARFAALDSDGDGYLDGDELRQTVFQRLDADGDGYLTAEELAGARERRPGRSVDRQR